MRAAPIQINYLGYPGTTGAIILIIIFQINLLFQKNYNNIIRKNYLFTKMLST